MTKTISDKTSPKTKGSNKKQNNASDPVPNQLEMDLKDTFTLSIQDQERRHLIQQHELQLKVQEDVHIARLRSIQSELQSQLYKIWNEAWLQRKKSLDQGFKEWLKVFMS